MASTEVSRGRVRRGGPGALGALLIALLPGMAGAELFLLDDGRAVAPMTVMLGDEGNWAQAVPAAPEAAASSSGSLRTEPETGGGLRAVWDGRKQAQLYLQAAEAIDIRELVEADGALVLLLKVNRAPDEDVSLRMGCGYPCQAAADVTRLFKAIPADTWGTVSFGLSCFTNDGLQADRVDAPLVLATSGEFSISLRQVAILAGYADNATVKCD